MSCSAMRFAVEIQALQAEMSRLGAPSLALATGPAAGNFPNPRAHHPFFYGVHAVEMLHTLLGPGSEAVTTHRTPHCDVAVIQYADGRQGVVNLLRDSVPVYQGILYALNGWGEANISDHAAYYRETLALFLAMVETGRPPLPIEWAVEVIALLTALVRSAEQEGRTVWLSEL